MPSRLPSKDARKLKMDIYRCECGRLNFFAKTEEPEPTKLCACGEKAKRAGSLLHVFMEP